MSGITTCLWFDDQAEKAVAFYAGIFGDEAEVGHVTRYGPAGPGPEGTVMTVDFALRGDSFVALNGGPVFEFTPAVSFQVFCDDQAEVDRFWFGLSEGGETGQCGWLTDPFGVSWQVVPKALPRLLSDPDPERGHRANEAMLKMTRLDIAELEAAADGDS